MPPLHTGPPPAVPDEHRAAAEFVLMLRRAGLRDTAVLRAMEHVPRVPFIDRRWMAGADMDAELPIACGQTLLRPTLVARMLEALRLQPHHKALLVGCGSGYMAAVMAHLCAEIVAIERWRRLADDAHTRLRGLGYHTVEIIFGDGHLGYTTRAPYDRIILTGAVDAVPVGLMQQLTVDGTLIAPIIDSDGACVLRRHSGPGGQKVETFGAARMRRLVPGVAHVL